MTNPIAALCAWLSNVFGSKSKAKKAAGATGAAGVIAAAAIFIGRGKASAPRLTSTASPSPRSGPSATARRAA